MPQHYTYTAADIERYHSGKMSEGEMHALEKAALADPFLADALEGYANTNSPAKDIAELKQRLSEKKKNRTGFFLITKENPWLRIAAVFVLIVGIGYFIYLMNSETHKSKFISLQDTGVKKAEQPIAGNKDSSSMSDTELPAVSLAEKKNAYALNDRNKVAVPDLKLLKKVHQTSPVLENNKPAAMLSRTQSAKEAYRDMDIIKGQVVDNNGKPVRNAFLKDQNAQILTRSDSTGRFQIPLKDSTVTAVVAAAGYKTKQKQLDNKTQQVVVMEPVDRRLDEVVVTASGISRQQKQASVSSVLQKKASEISGNTLPSKPAGDEEKFNEYVKTNITVSKDDAGKNYKGKVILSFEVNRKGKPKKIKVQQSLCASCDEEAIRLLEQGPKWKYAEKKRQTVTIDF